MAFVWSDLNYKTGYFGKGYYFLTPEEAYFRSLYNDLTSVNNIIKIPNNNYITYNTPIDNINITIQDNNINFSEEFYLKDQYVISTMEIDNDRLAAQDFINESVVIINRRT